MTYRGFSPDELERQYSPSVMVGGDISHYLAAYADMSAAARVELEVLENLKYGNLKSNILDFFPASEANAPLHVFVHGGYWQALSQRESALVAKPLVRAGQAFATLNYTLAPKARLDEMITECGRALLWLAERAEKLGFDPGRITLSGHSAGAHLAAMALYRFGEDLKQTDLVIRDLVLISGIYDLEPIAQTSVNKPLQLTDKDIASLSPIHHLPPADVRTRVTVAERDTREFIRQSRDFAALLRKAGRDVSFDVQKGMHHFDIIMHPDSFFPAPRAQV